MEKSGIDHNHKENTGHPRYASKKMERGETAQYIADMVLELRNLAKAFELKAVQDLLELCFYEAFSAANRVDVPEGEIEHLRELSNAARAG